MRGVTVALTGIIPNGIAAEDTEIGQQLRSFGAIIASRITRDVTHLVVNTLRPMTDKRAPGAAHPFDQDCQPGPAGRVLLAVGDGRGDAVSVYRRVEWRCATGRRGGVGCR